MIWWTLQNLAVATILAGLVQIACRAGRIGPVGRHTLWLIVLVKLLTPPLVVVHLPWSTTFTAMALSTAGAAPVTPPRDTSVFTPSSSELTARTLRDATPTTVRLKPDTTDDFETSARNSESLQALTPPNPGTTVAAAVRRWLPLAAWFWIAGALAFAFIQGIRIARVVRSLRRAGPADAALTEQAAALARRLGMRPVPIRLVPGIDSPSIWCVYRAELLWPADLPADMSDGARRGLIVHELAHVKRHDHWVGWLELAAGCVWWWNPLFWYVRSQLRENAELACDGWVVETLPHGRRAYAEALLTVCAGVPHETAPMPAVGIRSGSRRVLERRLVMIMRERIPLRLSRAGLSSVALLALATLPAWAQTAAPAASEPQMPSLAPVPAVVQVAPAPVVTETVRIVRGQTLPADAQRLIDRFAEEQTQTRREADEKIARQRQDLIARLREMQDASARDGRADEAAALGDQIRRITRAAAVGSSRDTWTLDARESTFVTPESRLLPPSADAGAPIRSGLSLQSFRGRAGQTMTLPVVGAANGPVWGDVVYTDDSSIAAAAVHAGLVAPGRLAYVRVTVLPGQDHYDGATRNEVTSGSYEAWGGSYRLELDPDPSPVIRSGNGSDAASLVSLPSLRGEVGTSLTIEVVGASSGQAVWGSDEYTDDSSLAVAAVHAGILRPGERGLVRVTILPGQETYAGSERNGVKTAPFGRWDGSFRIERAAAK